MQNLEATGGIACGHKNPEMLVTAEILANDFSELAMLENREMQVMLNEGTHHKGLAEVVRFLGRKT